ncbi:MAG TPA: Mur ligase family protein [Acidimicrobiales bacterium]|nr:Mur ligase family protein [Acidimicrobiales bacterium]
MDYAEALRWLEDRIDLEKTVSPTRLSVPSLAKMQELVGLLGDPQTAFPIIHVTGTNGKTSTSRILTRLLEVAGLTVGTYTSPDLESVRERISRNGEPISEEDFAGAISSVAAVAELMEDRPSRFESLTAAGFWWFADVAVHAAVVEVGLLGRWDATNVADGQVAVLTNVGADHLDYAGSVENIAFEKAGIVKPGSIFVLGEKSEELAPYFADTPAEAVWRRDEDFAVVENDLAVGGRLLTLRTPTSMYDELFLRLHGSYQGENASIALAACEAFLGGPLDQELILEAFDTVRSPGRLEVLGRQPLLLLDGAHNEAGAHVLATAIEEEFGEVQRWTIVLGSLTPHDPLAFLEALDIGDVVRVVTCEARSPRAIPSAEVAKAAEARGLYAEVGSGVAEAVARALAGASAEDGVLVTGSLYVVGEARAAVRRGVG